MNGYRDSANFEYNQRYGAPIGPAAPVNPASSVASGAAAGSIGGPYGALIGAGVGGALSIWDEMERRKQMPALAQAQASQGLQRTLFGNPGDATITQRYAESLAPTKIGAKTLAGGMGGFQMGESLDDYKFKQQMRKQNPWSAFALENQRGQV